MMKATDNQNVVFGFERTRHLKLGAITLGKGERQKKDFEYNTS
jgi:hypothetical protein